jgi:hypothetical protein
MIIDTFFNSDDYFRDLTKRISLGEKPTEYDIWNIAMVHGYHEASLRWTMVATALTLILTSALSLVNPLHPYQNLILAGIISMWFTGWMYVWLVNIILTPVYAIAFAVVYFAWGLL